MEVRRDPADNTAGGGLPAATKTKKWLVAFGVVCLALFVAGVALSYSIGTKETVVGHAGTTETITTPGGATKTNTVEANQTTTKKGALSDALLEAILGAGAILIIVGFLYGRITTIKLWGNEIDLSSDEVKKTAAEAQKTADAGGAPPEAVPGITATAIAHAREEKRATGSLSESDITGAVEQAVAGYMKIVEDGRA